MRFRGIDRVKLRLCHILCDAASICDLECLHSKRLEFLHTCVLAVPDFVELQVHLRKIVGSCFWDVFEASPARLGSLYTLNHIIILDLAISWFAVFRLRSHFTKLILIKVIIEVHMLEDDWLLPFIGIQLFLLLHCDNLLVLQPRRYWWPLLQRRGARGQRLLSWLIFFAGYSSQDLSDLAFVLAMFWIGSIWLFLDIGKVIHTFNSVFGPVFTRKKARVCECGRL